MSSNKINNRVNPKVQLSGKVVFVIGYDPELLRPLALGLAEKGADIALFCQNLPESIAKQLKSTINSFGQQIMFLNSPEYKPEEFSPKLLFQKVRQNFGQIDVFIDFSTQRENNSYNMEEGASSSLRADWALMKEVFKELVRTSMFNKQVAVEESAKNR